MNIKITAQIAYYDADENDKPVEKYDTWNQLFSDKNNRSKGRNPALFISKAMKIAAKEINIAYSMHDAYSDSVWEPVIRSIKVTYPKNADIIEIEDYS